MLTYSEVRVVLNNGSEICQTFRTRANGRYSALTVSQAGPKAKEKPTSEPGWVFEWFSPPAQVVVVPTRRLILEIIVQN